MIKRKRKKLIILSLAITLFFMGVGFALLSKNLDVTLTSESNGHWDIRIDTITLKQVNGNAVSRSYTHDGLTASFAVDLFTTGDYVEYEITVKNFGNIPAVLSSVTPVVPNTDGVIGFTNDAVLDQIIIPGASKVITVKISVDSNSNSDILNAAYSLTLVYDQFTTEPPSYDPGSYPSDGSSVPQDETKKLRILGASGYPELTAENMGDLGFGDLIGFGTSDISSNEQFYIVGGNGSSYIMLLSRYLINVGPHQKTVFANGERDTRGLQDRNIGVSKSRSSSDLNAEFDSNGGLENGGYLTGSVAFSSSAYWWDNNNSSYASGYGANIGIYDNSSIKTYVDSYASTLTSMGLATAFGNLAGTTTTITGGIMPLGLINYFCGTTVTAPGSVDPTDCPSFLFNTTYWIDSPYENQVYITTARHTLAGLNFTDSISATSPNSDTGVGIRPFIMVSISQ